MLATPICASTKLRPNPQGLLKALHRFVQQVLRRQRLGQVEVGFGRPWNDLHDLPVVGNGFVQSAFLLTDGSSAATHGEGIGVNLGCFLE